MMGSWQLLLVERSWSERNVYFSNDCAQQRLRLCPCCRYSQGCSDVDLCGGPQELCFCPKNNCHSNILLSSTLLTMYCLISSSHFHSRQSERSYSNIRFNLRLIFLRSLGGHSRMFMIPRNTDASHMFWWQSQCFTYLFDNPHLTTIIM